MGVRSLLERKRMFSLTLLWRSGTESSYMIKGERERERTLLVMEQLSIKEMRKMFCITNSSVSKKNLSSVSTFNNTISTLNSYPAPQI